MLKSVCSFCGCSLRWRLDWNTFRRSPFRIVLSHGMCKPCMDKALKEFKVSQ